MHKAALEYFALKGDYTLIDVGPEQAVDAVLNLVSDGYCGFNVTIPYKETIFQLSNKYTSEATRAGVANTVRITQSGLEAHNTDIVGFRLTLEEEILAKQTGVERATVIGAGGAARAAILALSELGISSIVLAVRDPEKALETVDRLTRGTGRMDGTFLQIRELSDTQQIPTSSVLINASPLGQKSDEVPPWFSSYLQALDTDGLFFDMVYGKSGRSTPLVRSALEYGVHAIDGASMLIHQARYAFAFWTGKLPPFAVMQNALKQAR